MKLICWLLKKHRFGKPFDSEGSLGRVKMCRRCSLLLKVKTRKKA